MTESKNTQQMNDDLVAAQSLGFDSGYMAEILNRYGPEVLSTVVTALKSGFSPAFVMELVRLFGPVVVDFLISLMTTTKKKVEEEKKLGLVPAEQSVSDYLTKNGMEGLMPLIMDLLLEKVLPVVLQEYGPQIIQAIIDTVVNNLKKKKEEEGRLVI